MYNPGHSLTVTYQSEYNADTNSLSSSFIPGNRDYYAGDTRDSDFYSDLEDACDALRP